MYLSSSLYLRFSFALRPWNNNKEEEDEGEKERERKQKQNRGSGHRVFHGKGSSELESSSEDSDKEDGTKDSNDDNFYDNNKQEHSDDEQKTVTLPYNRIHNDHTVPLKPKWNQAICKVLDGTSMWDIDIKLRVFYHDSPSNNVNINKHKSLEFIVEDDNVGGKKGEHVFYYTPYETNSIVVKSNWWYSKYERIRN